MKKKLLILLSCVSVAAIFICGCASNNSSSVQKMPKEFSDTFDRIEFGGALDSIANSTPTDTFDSYVNEPPYPGEYTEETWNTEEYDYQKESSFIATASNPFSTFAADVDTASYSNLRRHVFNNEEVNPDSVRTEELINYFRYNYPQPKNGEPFGVYTEISSCPWNSQTQLLRVGLQAKDLNAKKLPPSNLVFLIDVSGSMEDPDRLPLVKRSFMTLVNTLRPQDVVSIVTYADGERIVLDGVTANNKAQIMEAIEDLSAGGSTQGDQAIIMAYNLAKKHFISGGVNRVIMATDGDFNVGITSEGELTRLVQDKAKDNIFLSVLGYGMGNLKDNKLESMADNGNGNYAYVDSIEEARRVLVNEIGATLFTVAKDVKLQVEFNPALIKGYRLIGYENRTMAAEDFSNDEKDGGEIGAGHQVTALYEIVPINSNFELNEPNSKYSQKVTSDSTLTNEFCTVNIRYKEPDGDTSKLLTYPVNQSSVVSTMTPDMQWCAGVAQTAMLLKNSKFKGTSNYEEIYRTLSKIATDDFRDEFVHMLDKLK